MESFCERVRWAWPVWCKVYDHPLSTAIHHYHFWCFLLSLRISHSHFPLLTSLHSSLLPSTSYQHLKHFFSFSFLPILLLLLRALYVLLTVVPHHPLLASPTPPRQDETSRTARSIFFQPTVSCRPDSLHSLLLSFLLFYLVFVHSFFAPPQR